MNIVILIHNVTGTKLPIIYTVYIMYLDNAGWVWCTPVTLHDSQTLTRSTGECPNTLCMHQTHSA